MAIFYYLVENPLKLTIAIVYTNLLGVFYKAFFLSKILIWLLFRFCLFLIGHFSKVFDTLSVYRLTGTLQIKNGKLTNPSLEWEDLNHGQEK